MRTWAIIGILSAVVLGAGYAYYDSSQSRIEELVTNNSTLVSNVASLTEINLSNANTIEQLQISYDDIRENYENSLLDIQEIRYTNRELVERFNERDLGEITDARPELVERVINRASDNAMRCFELLTGSPLTEREIFAESGNDFNSECPWLWPGESRD